MPDVIVFDGVCGLCTRSVQFILAHEESATFSFAAVQSPAGERLLREFGFDPADVGSFVLIEGGQPYTKSEAALRVLRRLRRPWNTLRFLRVVPTSLRDRVYDILARNRYPWFGRRDSCMMPSPGTTDRFLRD